MTALPLYVYICTLTVPQKTHVIDYRIPISKWLYDASEGKEEEGEEEKDQSEDKPEAKKTGEEKEETDETPAAVNALPIELTYADIVSIVVGLGCAVWYLMTKHWCANNLIGVAFALQGIENLSVGSYTTGACLLVRVSRGRCGEGGMVVSIALQLNNW